MRKKPYPRNRDIRRAIRAALRDEVIGPHDLYDKVREILITEGFYVNLLSVKRVWILYEKMVRKGFIPDYFDVVVKE